MSPPRKTTARSIASTGAALLLLWGVSWGMSYVNLGPWSLFIAFAIAALKAVLVALFFMELLAEKKTSIHATLVTGLVMIAILIVFMIIDVRSRTTPALPPSVAHADVAHTLHASAPP